MDRILAGIETEYGLFVEGRGAEDQVDDAMALVRSYPGERFVGWDYRYESPRSDLRGFAVDRLQFDPADAKFDKGKARGKDWEVRSDRILANGARFYNDHGHPEYSTPECWSTRELALHDKAGELAVLAAARAFSDEIGREVRVYKNNTDRHGASYGTHESYLVPRALGFERTYRAVLPMLIARQVLCGAGKVGAEMGTQCAYQISQRADFLVEPFNIETLYRRPIFNTRDEPHASSESWMRLHVICGDANLITSATARKVGLVKLALQLEQIGMAPVWRFKDPVSAFQSVSRDEAYEFKIEVQGGSWTTAGEMLESYFSAAEQAFGLTASPGGEGPEQEAHALIWECRELLRDLHECPERFAYSVDWAAKKAMLEQFMASEGSDWRDPSLGSFDLEYHNIDRVEGLAAALKDMGQAEPDPEEFELRQLLSGVREDTRARARGVAVRRFGEHIVTAGWRSITFNIDGRETEVELPPDASYPAQLDDSPDVGTFIQSLGAIR
ncbi:MAG TPA: proteasome accessory factor PafA2 family protein [Fimbriimonadaceae bacterium]|nr:proteasome accessory factor PafA2 family protein [Fimbriimonadaceae bacterium]